MSGSGQTSHAADITIECLPTAHRCPMAASTSFRCVALPADVFAPLFELTDAQLRERGARRMTVDAHPGFPCRITLQDAQVGETVLLLSHEHQPANTPYRACGPIFVRGQPRPRAWAANEVPDAIRRRVLSVRAYDAAGTMLGAEVAEGRELEAAIQRHFDDAQVAYLHLHNAGRGCYACRIERA